MNNHPSGNGGAGRKALGVVLLVALVAAAAVVISQLRKPPAKPAEGAPSAAAAPGATNRPAAGSFGGLAGKWLRADGGYVLEIQQAADDGKLTAAYFNPQPIHVAKAQATREGSFIKVVVELRDTGYPGCIYTLLYDQPKELLRGTYFQAALGETYEISFERLKE